jgi:hypothetical protein
LKASITISRSPFSSAEAYSSAKGFRFTVFRNSSRAPFCSSLLEVKWFEIDYI